MNEEQPKLPAELQEKLVRVLQEVAIYTHGLTGLSHVVIHVTHLSDALLRNGQTELLIGVGGVGVKRSDGSAPKEAAKPMDPKATETMVNDLVSELMAKAKTGKPEAKPEEKKPE